MAKDDDKTEVDEAVEALGPVVPLGSEEEGFKPSSKPATGIQPLTQEDADALS